jgi:HK97 family phage major capsid protein
LSADLEGVLGHISTQLDALSSENRGSRFAGQAADEKTVTYLASGGSLAPETRGLPEGWRTVERRSGSPRGGLAGVMRKALAVSTDSSGGYLVSAEVSRDVLMGLRARSAVMRMGPTVVPLKKSLDIVSLSTGASAVYLAENAPIPISEQTFVQSALLTPKELAALVPVSDRLLRDADDNPSVEEIIRRDLAEVLALRADLAFLRGTGTGGEPRGIRNTPGLTPPPSMGTNGRQPTFDDLKEVVAALRNVNAPFARPGWVFHPRTIGTLEKFKDADGDYLAETGLLTFEATGGGGSLLNFPFRTTTQIPINLSVGNSNDASEIYFSSDWQEAWIGEEDELRIAVSGEATYTADGGATWQSAFQNRQHLFRATWTHDLGLRRPSLFTCVVGVRP